MNSPKLGRYEILGELGKGAMGVVFLARDPVIGRQVALKTFRLGYSAQDRELEQFRARFLREAQSAGILNHPSIVTIHDLVEADGSFFIAMEYVKGTDLKQLMQRHGRLETKFVIEMVAQIAEGLDYAHGHGVVHRDIKPANIIVTADKQAKITDFGIARVDASNLTLEGQLLGTPNYMAPEQIQGQEVDHRADLFSLGVMLYEMLTGHKPFEGENLTVVTHRIVYDAFTPPADHVPTFPPPLLSVLDRAMRKAPEERYSSGAEMARDLRRILLGTGEVPMVPATPPGGEMATVATLPPAANAAAGTVVTEPAALPPPTVSSPEPPPASKARRLGLTAAVATVVALGLAFLLSYALGPEPVEVEPPDPEMQLTIRYLPYLKAGQEHLDAGKPAEAFEAFERALTLSPGNQELLGLRDQAEEQIVALGSGDLDPEQVERQLLRAEVAYGKRDYEKALELAETVLAIEPRHAKARELRGRAREGVERRRLAQQRIVGGAGASPPSASPAVRPSSPPPALVASGPASLQIDFFSEISEGILTVYSGQQQIFKQRFEFSEKRGFRTVKTSGRLSDRVEVAAGEAKLKVYVWRKVGKETGTEVLEIGGELEVRGQHTLKLRLSAAGALQAELE